MSDMNDTNLIPNLGKMPIKQYNESLKIYVYRFLDWLFYRKLCGCAGRTRRYEWQSKFDCWQYNITGRIARYFHIRHCERCKRRYST